MAVTVHCIGNAHLDPVWLWPAASGVDSAVATARSACDRLDEYEEFVFTCSGRWFHQTVAETDPALFDRVRAHVHAGRWRTVGGMVIQPDCNLPSPEAFARQLAVGQRYYREQFGSPTRVGYNVDSFGHTAYLPRCLAEAGIDSYVFMRPGPHERPEPLPANLFRWRSPDGAEVLTFRIAMQYTTWSADMSEQLRASLADLPAGVEHTMCFFGVGDHGGGPTRAQIEWILDHRQFGGAELVFSHAQAYFDAVRPHLDALGVVTGELQHHAIGCYSVERRIKVSMRLAEQRLAQAAVAVQTLPESAPPDAAEMVERLWQPVLFNQFHDILGGTCTAGSGDRVTARNMVTAADAEDLTAAILRRHARPLAEPGQHKLAVLNPSDEPFEGIVEHEPWGCAPSALPVDADGRPVPFQDASVVAKVSWGRRLLMRMSLRPREVRVLTLAEAAGAEPTPEMSAATGLLASQDQLLPGTDAFEVAGWLGRLIVYDDPTDTWSHSAGSTFGRYEIGSFAWADSRIVEQGPVRLTLCSKGEFESSHAWCHVSVEAGRPGIRLRLSLVWSQTCRRLCLRLTPPAPLTARTDLVSGGELPRKLDGCEYPVLGGLCLRSAGADLAIAAPTVFSVSARPDSVDLTLLRSPYFAHHDPQDPAFRPEAPCTDQGPHEFDIVLLPGSQLAPADVRRIASGMLAPPVVLDVTG